MVLPVGVSHVRRRVQSAFGRRAKPVAGHCVLQKQSSEILLIPPCRGAQTQPAAASSASAPPSPASMTDESASRWRLWYLPEGVAAVADGIRIGCCIWRSIDPVWLKSTFASVADASRSGIETSRRVSCIAASFGTPESSSLQRGTIAHPTTSTAMRQAREKPLPNRRWMRFASSEFPQRNWRAGVRTQEPGGDSVDVPAGVPRRCPFCATATRPTRSTPRTPSHPPVTPARHRARKSYRRCARRNAP
jgi:hypothetical protein